MFFLDTRSSETSLVMVLISMLENYSLETPRAMYVQLRSFCLEGTNMPMPSISDDLFGMNDATDGK